MRYDSADGLYWMSVRAYDPTTGRFLSHDPLGRARLFFADNPYVYAGNNPVSNVDPSGERYTLGNGGGESHAKPDASKTTQAKTQRGHPKRGALHAGGLLCNPDNRACLITAITKRILWLITVLNFGVELVTTIAAIVFAVMEFNEMLDGDLVEAVNFVGDAATALSGLVALVKDGAILFGWGGRTFQQVMTLLTLIAKTLSAAANVARALLGGLAWLAIGDPGQWVHFLGEEIEKDFMPSVIKAIVGGLLFGGADAFNGGVAGLQYLLLTLPDTSTQQLPGLCQFLGAQC